VWLGEACAKALAIGLVAGLPSALRAAGHGASTADAWLAAAAVLVTLLVPVALIRDRAARGLRGVLGAEPPRRLRVGLVLWAALSALGFALLAAVLRAKTHHRGLGGGTFGVFGAAWLGVSAVASARLLRVIDRLEERGAPRMALHAGAIALALVPLLALGWPLLATPESVGSAGSAARGALLDLLLVTVMAALVLPHPVPEAAARPVRYAALPLAVCLLVVGYYRIERGAGTAAALRDGGGVPGAVLGALQLWSDADGDGHSAHFGGFDCDEGDPARHPGAPDPKGDGVDGDCDGSDGTSTIAKAPEAVAAASAKPTSAAPTDGSAATRSATTAAVSASGSAKAGASASTRPASHSAPSAKPDIVLVTLDTVRADHTSAYGYAKDTTPRLRALAKEGVRFEHAYAPASDTRRALAPLVSGLPLSQTPRSTIEWPDILRETDTVAERVQRAGYATAAVTSFTWLRKDRGFDQGFDHFDESAFRENHPERKSTGERATKAAIAAYDAMAGKSQPLFLWLHLFDAHEKYLTHDGIDFGKGPRARYDGEIAFVDRQLGKLIEHVAAGKRAAQTLWIVHGSHGEAFGEHDAEGHGTELYDEMIRVPLVIRAPGASAAKVEAPAVSTLDVAATVLDFADAKRKPSAGTSLRPAVEGKKLERAPVVAHAWRRTAVIDWPHKLIVIKRGKKKRDRLLLFDLAKDPSEEHDRSEDQPKVLARLEKLLDDEKP
jgi:arylsulfatase A-like enzyme